MREEFHIKAYEEQKLEVLRACGSSFCSRKASEMLEEETEKEEHTECDKWRLILISGLTKSVTGKLNIALYSHGT